MSQTPPMSRYAELYVAVVADVLDRMGHRGQVLDHRIRPLVLGDRMLAGRAHTILAVPDEIIDDNPYEQEIAAVDSVRVGEVIVISTQDAFEVSVWGELLATRAAAQGYAGVVLDGGVRDLSGLQRIGRPTFGPSVSANDSRGRSRVTEHGGTVVCGGVEIAQGDLVLADLDGVVIVPSQIVDEVERRAHEKVAAERRSLDALGAGRSAADVYAEHGVL